MPESAPILVCGVLTIGWLFVIFQGMGELFRKNSPMFWAYVGTWVCFALWYESWMKYGGDDIERNALVTTFYICFLVLGAAIGAFGSEERGI